MRKLYEIRVRVYDAMGVMPARFTRWYQCWESAHRRAEVLCKRYGARGRMVEEYREVD